MDHGDYGTALAASVRQAAVRDSLGNSLARHAQHPPRENPLSELKTGCLADRS
jgi:hypothetical protein